MLPKMDVLSTPMTWMSLSSLTASARNGRTPWRASNGPMTMREDCTLIACSARASRLCGVRTEESMAMVALATVSMWYMVHRSYKARS
jgi:hypothetical protein